MSLQVTIYLIHAPIPYQHAGHYCGVSKRPVVERMAEHLAGRGNSLVRLFASTLGLTDPQEAVARLVVAEWQGTRGEERRLKNLGGLARVCPVCRAAKGMKPYQRKEA